MYDLFRRPGAPTLYEASKTPVTHDVLLVGIFYCGLILFVSFLVTLPGYRGLKALFFFIRMVTGMFILMSIVVCNFGPSWEAGRVTSHVPYRAGVGDQITAEITVDIALRGLNITLKSKPESVLLANGKINESINYNERFSWNNEGWTSGWGAYGASDGRLNIEVRAAKETGKPSAILWIAEYFVLDGGDFRWGRFYRDAGFYVHGLLWLALPLWLISAMAFYMVLPYGGYFSLATGAVLLASNVVYSQYRASRPLVIQFEDGKLEFHFGWCFILCLFTGSLCIAIGVVVVFLDEKSPTKLRTFFDIDIGQDEEAEAIGTYNFRCAFPDKDEVVIPDIRVDDCDDHGDERQVQDGPGRIKRIHRRNTIRSLKRSITRKVIRPRLTSPKLSKATGDSSIRRVNGPKIDDAQTSRDQHRNPILSRNNYDVDCQEDNYAFDEDSIQQNRLSVPEEVTINFQEDFPAVSKSSLSISLSLQSETETYQRRNFPLSHISENSEDDGYDVNPAEFTGRPANLSLSDAALERRVDNGKPCEESTI